MSDPVYEAFLRRQQDDGLALARESSLLDLLPMGDPADRYLVRFGCRGLIRDTSGAIVLAEEFGVGISFPEDYVRRANPFDVLTWLGPRNVWHPNISNTRPAICIGRLAAGTGLVDLLYQCWEIITWNKVTMREDDALNREACQWARHNLSRLPVDRRPLKRRLLDLRIDDASLQQRVPISRTRSGKDDDDRAS
jgi:hypothetical protein